MAILQLYLSPLTQDRNFLNLVLQKGLKGWGEFEEIRLNPSAIFFDAISIDSHKKVIEQHLTLHKCVMLHCPDSMYVNMMQYLSIPISHPLPPHSTLFWVIPSKFVGGGSARGLYTLRSWCFVPWSGSHTNISQCREFSCD